MQLGPRSLDASPLDAVTAPGPSVDVVGTRTAQFAWLSNLLLCKHAHKYQHTYKTTYDINMCLCCPPPPCPGSTAESPTEQSHVDLLSMFGSVCGSMWLPGKNVGTHLESHPLRKVLCQVLPCGCRSSACRAVGSLQSLCPGPSNRVRLGLMPDLCKECRRTCGIS